MPNLQTCQFCKFCVPDDEHKTLTCHRRSPSPYRVYVPDTLPPAPPGFISIGNDYIYNALWPIVKPDDWCGEFTGKP